MCLTIPAQIIKIDQKNNKATIKINHKNVLIDITLLSAVKSKNWILYANGAAVRKITTKEAKEITRLLNL